MQQMLFSESPEVCHDIPGHPTLCLMFEVLLSGGLDLESLGGDEEVSSVAHGCTVISGVYVVHIYDLRIGMRPQNQAMCWYICNFACSGFRKFRKGIQHPPLKFETLCGDRIQFAN